jgi:2-polyprenyl-3-methyl-5-hydroxy-6-metoxy-1,4-benzoquinol methylase
MTMASNGPPDFPLRSDFIILDVGCGGGRTIEKLAALATKGWICGIGTKADSADLLKLRS